MSIKVFCLILSALLLALGLPAQAQQPGKVYRIGLLRAAAPPESSIEAFREGLKESGYIEGKNVIKIEYRYAGGRTIGFLISRQSWWNSRWT